MVVDHAADSSLPTQVTANDSAAWTCEVHTMHLRLLSRGMDAIAVQRAAPAVVGQPTAQAAAHCFVRLCCTTTHASQRTEMLQSHVLSHGGGRARLMLAAGVMVARRWTSSTPLRHALSTTAHIAPRINAGRPRVGRPGTVRRS